MFIRQLAGAAMLCCLPPATVYAAQPGSETLNLTLAPVGLLAIGIFALAWLLAMTEEFTQLRKSKPVILAAGILRAAIAFIYAGHGDGHAVETALRHNVLEFSELFLLLLLLAAMTCVNAMDERLVFESLRADLARRLRLMKVSNCGAGQKGPFSCLPAPS